MLAILWRHIGVPYTESASDSVGEISDLVARESTYIRDLFGSADSTDSLENLASYSRLTPVASLESADSAEMMSSHPRAGTELTTISSTPARIIVSFRLVYEAPQFLETADPLVIRRFTRAVSALATGLGLSLSNGASLDEEEGAARIIAANLAMGLGVAIIDAASLPDGAGTARVIARALPRR